MNQPTQPTKGRPVQLERGRRLNVYLDAETVKAAIALGSGNLSAGLRLAVARIINSQRIDDD